MRLLADRATDSISVRLFWNQAATGAGEIVVEYEDRSEGIAYVLYPPSDRALDAFYHPNAYLQLAGEQAA